MLARDKLHVNRELATRAQLSL